MTTADVTILGAGVFGLSIAYSCAKRGANVTVVEKRQVGSGASGGVVGALAPHAPDHWNQKKQFQLESLLMADDWWKEVSSLGGTSAEFARIGRIQPIPDQRAMELALRRCEDARANWSGRAEWKVVDRSALGTWRPESATGEFVLDTLSARLRPERALAALAEAIRRMGGRILENCRDAPAAGIVVHATGHEGLSTLSREYGRNVGLGVKGQALLLDLDARGNPQIFGEGVHIVPHQDGTTAIGSTSERQHESSLAADAKLNELHSHAIRLLPAAGTARVIRRWAGTRPRANSRAPMLGRHPLRRDEYVANGGFKIGFGIAPLVGEVMANLVLHGKDSIPKGFRPPDLAPKSI